MRLYAPELAAVAEACDFVRSALEPHLSGEELHEILVVVSRLVTSAVARGSQPPRFTASNGRIWIDHGFASWIVIGAAS